MTATTTSPRVCTRCIMDETVSGITFDDQGVCNHCHIHDTLDLSLIHISEPTRPY